jgi:hypothetical protein
LIYARTNGHINTLWLTSVTAQSSSLYEILAPMRLSFCVTASFNASDFKVGRETVIEELDEWKSTICPVCMHRVMRPRTAWSTVESMYGKHSSALWTNPPFFQFLPEDILPSI